MDRTHKIANYLYAYDNTAKALLEILPAEIKDAFKRYAAATGQPKELFDRMLAYYFIDSEILPLMYDDIIYVRKSRFLQDIKARINISDFPHKAELVATYELAAKFSYVRQLVRLRNDIELPDLRIIGYFSNDGGSAVICSIQKDVKLFHEAHGRALQSVPYEQWAQRCVEHYEKIMDSEYQIQSVQQLFDSRIKVSRMLTRIHSGFLMMEATGEICLIVGFPKYRP